MVLIAYNAGQTPVGKFSLAVEEEAYTFQIDRATLSVVPRLDPSAHMLSFTPQAWTQIAFGFDSIGGLSQPLSNDLTSVLSILFPASLDQAFSM
jgi:hypothetical protein